MVENLKETMVALMLAESAELSAMLELPTTQDDLMLYGMVKTDVDYLDKCILALGDEKNGTT